MTNDKRTETHACDLISRQAAIDALAEWHDEAITNRLNNLPSAQSGWIPCKTALPKKYDNYLITTEDDDTNMGIYHPALGRWSVCDDDGFRWKRVLAWMPLPTPYREGGQDNGSD